MNDNFYFETLKSIPRLNESQEKELLTKWCIEKDTQARDIIIQNNLRLVASIAKSYLNLGLSYDDLIQEGNLGLMYAIDNFDMKYNNRLGTYAAWWIRHYITRSLSNSSRIIRIPANIIESNKDVDIQEPISIDTPINEDDDGTYRDFIPDIEHYSIDDKIMLEELSNELANILATLDNREAEVIKKRFGLNGFIPQTLEEIGVAIGVSKERIRQIERDALRKLRHPMRAKLLQDFV